MRIGAGRSRPGWQPPTRSSAATYTVAYIAHAPLEPRAAVAEWDGRQADGLDRHAAAVRRARRAGAGVRHARGARPRDRARHGLRLRRQAHRRGGRRGGPAGEGGRASRSSWSGRARRSSPGPTSARPASSRSGAARRKDGTLTAWEFHNYNSGGSGIGTPYDVRQPADRVPRRPTRRCARARTGPWPPRPTTSPARSHMDELAARRRAWTRWRSA